MNPCASAVRASREACPTGTLLCLLHGTGAEGVHLAAGCETSGSGRGRSGRVRVCGRAGLARLTQRRISRAGPEGAASARLHRGGGRGGNPPAAPGVNRPDSGIVVFFRKPTTRLRRDHPGMPHTPPLGSLRKGERSQKNLQEPLRRSLQSCLRSIRPGLTAGRKPPHRPTRRIQRRDGGRQEGG